MKLKKLQDQIENLLLGITKSIRKYGDLPQCVSFGQEQIIKTDYKPPKRNNNNNYNWCTVKATLTEFYQDRDPQTVNREVIKQLTQNARFALVKAKLVEAAGKVTDQHLLSILKGNSESSIPQKNKRKV